MKDDNSTKLKKESGQELRRYVGRPTKYTAALADEVCVRLARGQSLVRATAQMGIDDSVVYDWLRKYPEFASKYAHAREVQADFLAEQTLDIADEPVADSAAAARNRLRFDARRWYASKLAPKKYADKIDTTLSSPNGGPVQVAAVNLRGLSDADLATMQQILSRADG